MSRLFTRVVAVDDIRIRSGGDGRTVEAYAAVFDSPVEISDVDGDYREQITRSAFNKTLSEQGARAQVIFNHGRSIDGFPSDRYSMPLGVAEEIRADGKGLFTVTRYSRSELADEVLELIRMGAIRGQSFSGLFPKSTPRNTPPRGGYRAGRDGALPLVTRTEIALREYGPTPFPAYEGAAIVGVRAALAEMLKFSSASTTGTTPLEPDPGATPDGGAGAQADEPHLHSARQTLQRIRAARIARGLE